MAHPIIPLPASPFDPNIPRFPYDPMVTKAAIDVLMTARRRCEESYGVPLYGVCEQYQRDLIIDATDECARRAERLRNK